jgi:RNA polymerase-binding transcription factor DksA
MTDQELKNLEQRLLQERDRANRALARLDEAATIATEDDGDLTTYSQHLADNGTDTMEQEKSLMLLSQEAVRLNAIDEALQRIYKQPERYGRCDECGAEIPFARLDVVPWARHCLDCQRRLEDDEAA